MRKIRTIFSLVLALCLMISMLSVTAAAEDAIQVGDTNADGGINNVDAMLILQYAVGLIQEELSADICDVNTDGDINNVDAMLILQYTVGLVDKLPVEPCTHEWTDANYQDAKTCRLCGAADGRPLTPDFQKHGLTVNVQQNQSYPYVTQCYRDLSLKTTATLTVTNYRVFQSDDTHAPKEGWEWRAFDVSIKFDDDNAWNYGMQFVPTYENYYDINGWDDSYSEADDTYTVNFHGVDYPGCRISMENSGFAGWADYTNYWTAEFYCLVPAGYDGVVIGFYDYSNTWEEGMYIYDVADENTLFFRLD